MLLSWLVLPFRERKNFIRFGLKLLIVLPSLSLSDAGSQYSNILMLLRKAANHPLLLRSHYKDDLLLEMAKKYCKVLLQVFI